MKDYRPVLPEHVPPRKVVEILATDDDDRSKSNGPPFQFRLDPGADDIIRASFKVEQDQSQYQYELDEEKQTKLSLFFLFHFQQRVQTVMVWQLCHHCVHSIANSKRNI